MAFDLLTTSALYAGLQSIGQFGTDHGLGGIAEGYSDRRACTLIGKLFSVLSPDPPPDALALLRMARHAHHDATLELLEQCLKDRTLDSRLASTQRDKATLQRILAFVKQRRANLANEIPAPLPANVAALLNEKIDSTTRTRSLEQLMLEHFEAEIAPALNGDPVPQLLTKYLRQGWRVLGNDTRYHPRTWYSLISIHFLRAVHANPAPLHTQLLLHLAANQTPPPDLTPILNQLLLDEDARHRRHAELLAGQAALLEGQADLRDGQAQLMVGQAELRADLARGIDLILAQRPLALTLDPERPLPTVHFIGREPELANIEQALFQPADPHPILVCSVNGLAGIGKSYLCDEFAHRHRERFPGGYLRFPLDPQSPRTSADLLAELADRLGLKVPAAQHAAAIRAQLKASPALLHLENIDSDPVAREVAVFVRDLHGCSILISGRIESLGQSQGWTTIPLSPFTRSQSLALLTAEFRAPRDPAEQVAFDRLADFLGDLPLAIHLAAGQLRAGLTIDEVIELGLELAPADPTDPLYDQARGRLRSSFAISRELLLRSFPESERPLWRDRLDSFGYAPLCGVGPSLGAAICGCTEPEFRHLMRAAQHLSLVAPLPNREHAWRTHTLVSTFLRDNFPSAYASAGPDASPFERMTGWFLERLPGDRVAQQEVLQESDALLTWLSELKVEMAATVAQASLMFARNCPPYSAWIALFQKGLDSVASDDERSLLLNAASQFLILVGELSRAKTLAQEKVELDLARNDDAGVRVGLAQLATILEQEGSYPEAMQLWQTRLLPAAPTAVDRAIIWGRIATLHEAMGDLPAALRIRDELEIPVLKEAHEAFYLAVAQGQKADLLVALGRNSDALPLYLEHAIPAFERAGFRREAMIKWGKVADLLQTLGDFDQAMKIREKEIALFEELGDKRSLAVSYGKVADTLFAKGDLLSSLSHRQKFEIPMLRAIGDRVGLAIANSKMADVHLRLGDHDTALKILRESLSVFRESGDQFSWAVSVGKVAMVYSANGKRRNAARIIRSVQLPLLRRLENARYIALASGALADNLESLGELAEALRIRREETLPTYIKVGDRRNAAVTIGKIAAILAKTGQFDEAIEIRRDLELPVYDELGLRDSIAIGKANLAILHMDRNQPGDADIARALLLDACRVGEEVGLPELNRIRELLGQIPTA